MAVFRGYCDTLVGQVHYRRSGPWPPSASTPCILLLHQLPSDGSMWEALMSTLPQMSLVAPDMPGFGGTPDPVNTASMQLYVAAAIGTLDTLGIQRCGVLGHHFGAGVAVQLVSNYPDRIERVMLSGPPFFAALPNVKAAAERIAFETPPASDSGAHATAEWSRLRGKEPDIPIALSQREFAAAMRASRYPEAYAALLSQSFESQAASIRCPVMLTTGPLDTLRSALEPTKAIIPHALDRWIEEAGSYVFDRQTGAVAEVVQDFFSASTSSLFR